MVKSLKKTKTAKKKAVSQRDKATVSTIRFVPDRAAATDVVALRKRAVIDADQNESAPEDFADVSHERASIISIVKGLEEQVETAFKLKEVLEEELDTTQKRLAEESDARSQLEAEVEVLQVRATLADQLREDISFAEQERNTFANMVSQLQPRLEQTIAERDSLAEQLASAESTIKELEGEKMTLEAHVMNLKEKIADTNLLRGELAEITEANQDLRGQLHNITRRLESTESSKDSIEKELDRSHQSSRNQQKELEDLRDKIAISDNRLTDIRIELEDQQVINRDLMETNMRLENELGTLNINYEAAMNELNASRDALREIRSEASETSGRVRQRYFKPASASTKV